MEKATLLGPLCAFGASVTWAVGSAGYSRLSRGHSPFAINFARATVALPLLLICLLISQGGPAGAFHALAAINREQAFWMGLSIFASYGLGDVFFMWSTRSLGVPAALAIGSTYPLLTAGLGAVLQGETLTMQQLGGLLLTVLGVIIVILNGAQPTPASSEGSHAAPSHLTRRSVGVALAFGTMVMWALNSVGISRGGQGIDPLSSNCLRMAFALGMTSGFGQILAPGTELTLPFKVLKKSLPIFVFEAFGGSLLFVYGLSHSPLAVGSTLASLAPVLSVPVALVLKLEKFSFFRTLGVCLVMVGIWFLLGVI
jgi:drug/metabolite transporter (DMT)-like permease